MSLESERHDPCGEPVVTLSGLSTIAVNTSIVFLSRVYYGNDTDRCKHSATLLTVGQSPGHFPLLVAWCSGYRRSSHERSYPTLGPVSTGMGDCLWAGIPSQYVTSQLGQLSLASLRGC